MDFESLRIFVDLADTHSFSKTAERSYMSQSAVSQRIRALEADFGQTLVERGKGRPGATFTDAGQCLLDGSRELLERIERLRREMAEVSGEISGTLRVATVYSVGLHALPPYLSRFLAEYPQVNLHLEYLRTDRVYEQLLNGGIDLGIVACPRERPQIDIVPMGEDNMVLIMPPSHPLAAYDAVPLNALEGQPFIAFDPHIPTRGLTDELLIENGVTVDVLQAFDNIETIKRVVEIGQGVAIVPETTVQRELIDKTLVSRPLKDVDFRRPTGILLRKGRIRSGALSKFIDVLCTPNG